MIVIDGEINNINYLMKKLIILLLAIVANNIVAQELNRFGHIIDIEEKTNYTVNSLSNNEVFCTINNLKLKGNSVFEIKGGYLTLDGCYENTGAAIRVYNKKGKEVDSQLFKQTINFKLSPNKTFAAFFDGEFTNALNLNTFKITKHKKSTVFAINNQGEICYYNEESNSININDLNIPIQEAVYTILNYKSDFIITTKAKLFKITENKLEQLLELTGKRIFEIKVKNSDLFISTKEEKKGSFIFELLKTNDLLNFNSINNNTLKLRSNGVKKAVGLNKQINSIRDPLNYDLDTVYQGIGNSYSEIQEYSFGAIYTHPGVDLFGYDQQPVSSVKKGYIKAILTTSAQFHWRVAIADNNTSNQSSGYLYAHLEETSIPYAVGDSIMESDTLAVLVNFPVNGFVHCHFAKIYDIGLTWAGNWWTYENPLTLISTIRDTTAPIFEKTINADAFAFKDSGQTYLPPNNLHGKVRIISKFYDNVNSTWNIDVNKVSYNLSPYGMPSVILFNHFSYEYNFPTDVYGPSTYSTFLINTIYSRDNTCFSTGNYNTRDFFHNVSSSDGNDTINNLDSLEYFNTVNFPDGGYIIRVHIEDAAGNTANDSMVVFIQNSPIGLIEKNSVKEIKIFPNPSNGIINIVLPNSENYEYTIFTTEGKQLIKGKLNLNENAILCSQLNQGLYLIEIRNTNTNETIKQKINIIK